MFIRIKVNSPDGYKQSHNINARRVLDVFKDSIGTVIHLNDGSTLYSNEPVDKLLKRLEKAQG